MGEAEPGRELATLGYLDEYPGGPRRPYLWLDFTGPNGSSGEIFGLIDTGADSSVLPLGYAGLMGYGADDLDVVEIHVAGGGSVDGYQATVPCQAAVVGLEHYVFNMTPVFVQGADALWGREDFMQAFGVFFEEAAEHLGLLLPPGIPIEP